ncbi:uncharacterized protein involved in exopolysaccharide biosynthesis [Rhizobium sp. BK650]|uniref:Wzz/FepE/Etk N-terminal domain-containing protein n=1 Tax=Rhizobium sp. BK650 TaxID=2586990 RepID=UPI001615D06C|nr:Wzz/FepE/Etk N-terminal domain-containing protein [Rhizobium sp. BK650]MBB3659754.1 uncharacterized protein involved in exopolysaccharide biosynthesis [Rhizobium sp. BK650]
MHEKRFDEEINLFVLASFVRKHILVIGACSIIGLIGASVFSSEAPPVFEASAQLALAKIGRPGPDRTILVVPVESRDRILFRMRSPAAFDLKLASSCFEKGAATREQLARSIKITAPSTPDDVISISSSASSAQLAERCVTAVVQLIQEQQSSLSSQSESAVKAEIAASEKQLADNLKVMESSQGTDWQKAIYLATRDESNFLRTKITELNSQLQLNEPAKLLSPVYAAPPSLASNRLKRILIGLVGGFAIGILGAMAQALYGSLRKREA